MRHDVPIETRPRSEEINDFYRTGTVEFNVQPGHVTGIYLYCCAACKKTVSDSWQHYGTPFNPGPPVGWTLVNEIYYCQDHTVKIVTHVEDKVNAANG